MFFVTVGSISYEFSRLINALNDLPKQIREKIIYQGYISNTITKFNHFQFMERDEYLKNLKNAELIITHCGIGSIYECVNLRKKTIIIPRLANFGEHNNNHQMEIFNEMSRKPLPNIYPLKELENIKNKILEVMKNETSYSTINTSISSLKKEIEQAIINYIRQK